jgi:hypothetical protein
MTSNDDEQVPQPADPGTETAPAAQVAADEADTEGHSMLTVELARTMSQDRAREVTRLNQESARARDLKKDRGGFLKRFGRR